jgi:hypothetical protein
LGAGRVLAGDQQAAVHHMRGEVGGSLAVAAAAVLQRLFQMVGPRLRPLHQLFFVPGEAGHLSAGNQVLAAAQPDLQLPGRAGASPVGQAATCCSGTPGTLTRPLPLL